MTASLSALLSGPVETVAPRLLGAVLRHGRVAVRLTEVEAYGGARDAGSHAHRGPTRRNAAMFGPPGRLYCYLSYGIHVCANVVCGPAGTASAVLLRAGELVAGQEEILGRPGIAGRDLARGPARLCRTLGIELVHDGTDLATGPVRLLPPTAPVTGILTGPRVGLTREPDRPWRFWLAEEPTVSAYRRSPRAVPSRSRSVPFGSVMGSRRRP